MQQGASHVFVDLVAILGIGPVALGLVVLLSVVLKKPQWALPLFLAHLVAFGLCFHYTAPWQIVQVLGGPVAMFGIILWAGLTMAELVCLPCFMTIQVAAKQKGRPIWPIELTILACGGLTEYCVCDGVYQWMTFQH